MKVTEETKQHAQDILDYFEANPKDHVQSVWGPDWQGPINTCGSVMCVAGLSTVLKNQTHYIINPTFQAQYDDGLLTWADFAQFNLGLSPGEADKLFYCMAEPMALDGVRAIAAGDSEKFNEIFSYEGDIEF